MRRANRMAAWDARLVCVRGRPRRAVARGRTFVLLVALLAPGLGAAYGQPARRVWLFSSMCTEPQSGDTAGYMIGVTPSASAPLVTFGWSEGGPMTPVRARHATLDQRTGALSFEARVDSRRVSFSGGISPERLLGTLIWRGNVSSAERQETVRLTRVRDLHHQPACKAQP